MKYALIIMPIILTGLCVAQTDLDLKNCASDSRCFYDATEKCEPAKLSVERLRPGTGSQQIDLYAEVQGVRNDKCIIFVRYTNVANIGEVSMTCESPRFENNTYVRVLEDINNIYTYCEGSLIRYFVPD